MRLKLSALALLSLMVSPSAFALRVKEHQVILDSLSDYENCQSRDYSGDACHEAMQNWVKAHPADAFAAGKATRKKMNGLAAVGFFSQAFAAGAGNCKDEDVKLAVVSGLDASSNQEEIIAQSKAIAFGKCASEMKEAVLKEASIGSNVFKNSCKELVAAGALTGLKAKKCKEGN